MFNLKKGICFLSTMYFALFTNIASADFTGTWCWDKDNNESVFSIVIHKTKGIYKGGYYSVTQSGNRIDDNDTAFAFNTMQKTVQTKIKAGITGNIGLIQLKILNDKIINWQVIQHPKGEMFVPKAALLHRCN